MNDFMNMALTNAFVAAVLGAIVAVLTLGLSKRPALAHALWVLVLLKLVTPPLVEISIGSVETAAETDSFTPADDADLEMLDWAWADEPELVTLNLEIDPEAKAPEPASGTIDADLAWRLVGGLWLAGTAATVVLAAVRIGRFQRRLRDASPAGWAVEDEVAALAAEMGLRRPPLADFIDARTTPMIWGLGLRPRLILPRMLWKELDARRRTLLLTHELAHLKRGDHLLRFLELAVTALYWWFPVVWWARKALRDVEEQCCDAWVVWMHPDDARAYAETLLETVDFLNPRTESAPLLASGFGEVQHLRKRLTMVMRGTTPRTLGWKGSLGAMTLAGALLPIGPTWAQKAPETESLVSIQVTDDPIGGTVITADHAQTLEGGAIEFLAESSDDVKTVLVAGPVARTPKTENVTITTVVDDGKAKDEAKDKAKDEAKDKAKDEAKDKVRQALRFEFRGTPGQAREGIKKAVEELKGRIKELESKEPREEGADVQIQALTTALKSLEKLAEQSPASIDVKGRQHTVGNVIVRGEPLKFTFTADPKVAEAQQKVEELQKALTEKQKEMSDTIKKLAEAQHELAKVRSETFRAMPNVNARVAEIRNLHLKDAPAVAEGRVRINVGDEAKDEARIDALEKKLDKVLKQLEGLKQPESEKN